MSAVENHVSPSAKRPPPLIKPSVPSSDESEILRAIHVLHDRASVVELRALHKRNKRVDAGCFDGEHWDALAKEAARLNAAGASIYVTLNEPDPQLLARYANRVQDYAQATATDSNIVRRRWLLVDIDPQRPKDTSATDRQLELAQDRTEAVKQFLDGLGWADPVIAESGNGYHLLYRIDLPNHSASTDLVKRCLEALAEKFDDADVKVDRAVFNAARIVKLHGTVANKGDNIPDAPWRLSRLTCVPDEIATVSLEQLQELASHVKTAPLVSTPKPANGLRSWTSADMEAFLARGNIEATGPDSHDGAQRWKLKACPFNPDHGPGESAVFLRPDGVLGFDCRHNSCQDKHWRDVRALVDGERRSSPSPFGSTVGAPARTIWSGPKPLPEGLPAVPAFELELLPDVLRARVEDIADRMQCPADFPAVALMVSISSVIGRRCAIAPRRQDDWMVGSESLGRGHRPARNYEEPSVSRGHATFAGFAGQCHRRFQKFGC